MKKSFIHPVFAIIVLVGFTACEKKTDTEVESGDLQIEESSQSSVVVEELKEDLKEIAAKAEAEAKEVVESVKDATAEKLEIAKEKMAIIKAEAAEDMAEAVKVADEQMDEAGAALKAAKDDTIQSLNSFLNTSQEESSSSSSSIF
ncbi:MAG: hypothetical protein ACN4GF_10285 [Lentimonas sp.]